MRLDAWHIVQQLYQSEINCDCSRIRNEASPRALVEWNPFTSNVRANQFQHVTAWLDDAARRLCSRNPSTPMAGSVLQTGTCI